MDTSVRLSRYTSENIYDAEKIPSGLTVKECIEISYVYEGSGIHRVLNETTECQKGDMYIIGSGVPHAYFAKSSAEKPSVCSIELKAQTLEAPFCDINNPRFCFGVFRDNSPVAYALLNSKAFAEVNFLFEKMEREETEKNLEWNEALLLYVKSLLITLSRYVNMADTEKAVHPKEWTLVLAAMREIFEHYSESDMTLESIAHTLYISKSQLSKLFVRAAGESFLDYVRAVRINKACELLSSTNLTNEEIVRACGLRDIPSFYKLFKSVRGKTPYQYRLQNAVKKGAEEKTMSILNEISENLQRGKAKAVKELVENAISEGIPAAQILNEGLLSGMGVVGEKFKNNEVYVPEVLVAARAMNTGVGVLKPLLSEDGVAASGRVCIGTVQGDLHDIGKNLVKLMMEGKGLEVIDLGTDVAPEAFVQSAIDNNCTVICCSALLTTTMDSMAQVVKTAEAMGVREKLKIMVGGAPVTEEFCRSIGADCYTSDAASAADAAADFCK